VAALCVRDKLVENSAAVGAASLPGSGSVNAMAAILVWIANKRNCQLRTLRLLRRLQRCARFFGRDPERGRALEHEELVGVGGKFPLRVVDAGDLGRHYAAFARIYYATETLEVRQVLLPDPQGRWPDTPGCAAPYREQPILSAAAKTPN